MQLTYRQLQASLKEFKAQGKLAHSFKLNQPKDVLLNKHMELENTTLIRTQHVNNKVYYFLKAKLNNSTNYDLDQHMQFIDSSLVTFLEIYKDSAAVFTQKSVSALLHKIGFTWQQATDLTYYYFNYFNMATYQD